MLCKVVSLILAAALLHGSIAAQDQLQSSTQSVARMQQVLRKAHEKDKYVKITLNKKIENQGKFVGKVSAISDTDFTFIDRRTGESMQVAYADVREVKQKGMPKGAKIAIVVAVGVAVWIGIVIGVAGGLPD